MTPTLPALLERVEKAEGPDLELDVALLKQFEPKAHDHFMRIYQRKLAAAHADGLTTRDTACFRFAFNDTPAYTASIDAALSLVDKALSGWQYERRVLDTGTFIRLVGPHYLANDYMGARNPQMTASIAVNGRVGVIRSDALAILAALLRAKLAETTDKGE